MVTCFLLRGSGTASQVLLLRRSGRVRTYQGRWAGVSGYLVEEPALEQAYRELQEETGLTRQEVRLLSEGEPLLVTDEEIAVRWTVHPFLFEALRPERVRLDWEHGEARWVWPEDLSTYETVPGLSEALARVWPPGAPRS